jgi:hypothetical protein
MQEEEKKTVDIDTSGPEVDIQLPEEKTEEVAEQPTEDKTYENERETKLEDGGSAGDSSEKPVEQSNVQEDNSKQIEEYSEGVKKRIAKLTKRMREAERQKEEALRFADSVKKERDQFKTTADSLDKNYVAEMEGRITSSIAAAQEKLRAARQAEDPKAETEALAAISQLGYEQGKLAELKTQHQMQETAAKEQPVEQPLYQQPKQQAQTPPDPKAEEWAMNNEWFGKDSAMTYTAFDLHRKLTEEEGIDPRSEEYYEEIDKRIRLEFPHKFDTSKNKPVSKPTQTVASATRSPKTSRKSVRLTSSQVAIAKKLGVPLEEYAKQLMNTKEV